MALAIARPLDRSALTRLAVAGVGWGLIVAAGFFVLNASQCGPPCPDDVVATTTICIAAGLLTIGPLAAFGRR
jgi:hypothetical protein